MANKRAFILGGTSQIMQAVIDYCAHNGFDVYFTYHHHQQIAENICNKYPQGQVKSCAFDISDRENFVKIHEFIQQPINLYINAIAVAHERKNFQDLSPAEITAQIQGNITNPLLLFYELHHWLSDDAVFIQCGSKVVHTGGNKISIYAASKAAWQVLMPAWARENPQKYFYAVNPPAINDENLSEICGYFINFINKKFPSGTHYPNFS